jgi:DNA-directed RNA polymerase subunit alpha
MTELLTMEGLTQLQPAEITWGKLRELKAKVSADPAAGRVIGQFVADQLEKAKKLRAADKVHDSFFIVGALQWTLCRYDEAAESLTEVKRDDFARELEADSALKAGMFSKGFKLYAKLAEKTSCAAFDLATLACLRGMGETKQADDLLASFAGKYVKEVEYHYQVGLRHDLRSDYDAAIASYEKALAIDPSHVSSMFRLGYIADLRGDEDEAIKFYERCLTVRPAHVNALINLGVLYEDSGRYDDAVSCFERVLQWNPNHERAGLFLRDAEASLTMYYDEELERQVDRQNKVLEIPVTDFELSVRSRNCLERMNVKSLGDLTHITEPDLLSYKNFGETSLSEVKAMMTSRGLRLGQALEKDSPHPKAVPVGTRGKTEGDGVKSRPIGELELSVRSRKCMQRLAIATVGDLCDRSEDELLDCKNFGQTSLNEIRQKLANLGLKLKENK